jgi:hypothetical protein
MVMKVALQPEPEVFTVAAGEFKAKCLRLMDEANEKQRNVAVTKRGKLVGHFVPVPPEEKPFYSVVGYRNFGGHHLPAAAGVDASQMGVGASRETCQEG